ncbi:MAG: hypothetical protein ACRCWF_10645 [Beijerinckiaceae bacterium]
MPITNVKRKLEQARDAIITIARQNDNAFNPYEIMAIVTVGDVHLGDALPPSRDLAKIQVELADIIFRHVASDARLLSLLQEMTQGFQEQVPASQKKRLRSAAQDGALIILATSVLGAACLACFDLFQSRERINIAGRTVKRNARSRKVTVATRRSNAATAQILGLSEEARSDRIRVRRIVAKSRSTRLDRTPEVQPPAPVQPTAIPPVVPGQMLVAQAHHVAPKEPVIRRATQMNSNGGPVLPEPVF